MVISNCLKERLLNWGIVSPTEVGLRHQGDIDAFVRSVYKALALNTQKKRKKRYAFFSRSNITTDFFHDSYKV